MSTKRTLRTLLFWVGVVVTISFISAALGYIETIVTAIGSSPFQQFYGVTSVQFDVLLFVFAVPGLLFPYLTGVMIDLSLGIRLSSVVCVITLVMGQLLWNLSGDIQHPNFHLALVGAMVLGIALESMWTAQLYLTALWFAGRSLALSIALVVIFRELASYVVLAVTEPTNSTIKNALYAGSGIVIMCFLCVVVQVLLVKKFAKKRASPRDTLLPMRFHVTVILGTNLMIFCLFSVRYFWIYSLDTILTDQYEVESEDVSTFTAFFFAFCLVCLVVSGLLVDRKGYHLFWVQIGSVVLWVGTVGFVWFPFLTLWVNLLVSGSGYAFCLLPLISHIPLLLRKKFWAQGFGLNVVSITAARCVTGGVFLCFEHWSVNPVWGAYLSVAMSSVCVLIATFLNYYDFRNSFIMNKSNTEWVELLWDPLGAHSS